MSAIRIDNVKKRYGTLQAEATAAIVVSTLAFAGTASLWLAVLHALP